MRFKKYVHKNRPGAALIIEMIFVLIFSTLAVSMAALSGSNVQIADNHHKGNSARATAESGVEIVRFWINRVAMPGTTPTNEVYANIVTSLQSDLTANGISNITTTFDGTTLSIPSVTLASNETFSASITQLNTDTIQINVTGISDTITRTIQANYNHSTRANSVFDFGIATRGSLHLAGNIELTGTNASIEASVYIESQNSNHALTITGNSQIAGNVSIVNPSANVDLHGGQAGIGGETGQDAIDNHVSFGVPPTEFPMPNPGYFEQYVVNTIDSSTDTTVDATFENVRILAGTNPIFSGNVTFNGIVFIETPNVVTFTGSTDLTGIIAGDGDWEDNSRTNQIRFFGNVDSYSVTDLPDEPQFAGIREETGTFLMAPGFNLSFGGNFDAVNGAIAGNGIKFFGNASGTINGSIINYADNQMNLSGNSDLFFNRSGTTEIPAGFIPEIVLQYDPSSYSEIIL